MRTLKARRFGALIAGGAVVASGLVVASGAPVHAAEANLPTATAVAWLEAQLTDADVFGADASSVTKTIDFASGLVRTGADDALLARVVSGIDAHIGDYVGTSGDTETASRVAKAAGFYTQAADPHDVAGLDLITRLEAVIGEDGGLEVTSGGWAYDDYFNQPAAVVALSEAGSEAAGPARQFLLDGQCADGGWGYVDTSTDPAGCYADSDTTSMAILGLLPQVADDAVATAVAAGVAYLVDQQAADGSFGESFYTPYNSNSTGLAAQALQAAGADEAASAAAIWVRSLQLTGSACDVALAAEAGMIAYSDAALAGDLEEGLADRSAAISSSAQAFPALAFAPSASGSLTVSAPRWVKANSTVAVLATGLAPGERGCASLAGKRAVAVGDASGRALVSISVPAGTRNYKAGLRSVPRSAVTTPVTALAPKTLTVTRAKARVAPRRFQTARIVGLVPGERAVIRYGTRIVRTGVANANGAFAATFRVGRVKGIKRIHGQGQFTTRRGTVTFRVR